MAFSSLKIRRIKDENRDFQIIYKEGKSYANKYLVMYIRENNTDQNRLGISVSKKVGK